MGVAAAHVMMVGSLLSLAAGKAPGLGLGAAAATAKLAVRARPDRGHATALQAARRATATAARAPPRGKKAAQKPPAQQPSDLTRYSKGALIQRFRPPNAESQDLGNVVTALREKGCLENSEGYVHLLRSVEHGEHWQWALHLLDEAWARGIQPDHLAHSVGMAACGRAGQWERAMQIMDDMTQKSVQRDSETFQAAGTACSRNGQWAAAVALFDEAQGLGVADNEMFSVAMMACASSGAWEAALALLATAEGQGLKDLDLPLTYNMAVFGCMRGAQWARCLALMDGIRAQEVQPDVETYACISQACKTAKQWQASARLLKDMRGQGITEADVNEAFNEWTWVLDFPELAHPVALSTMAEMAPKEAGLYKFVHQRATPGDIDSVIEAIESYAKQKRWLKIQGDQKRRLLEETLRPGDRIVEFGCYVGYSSLCMVRQLRHLGGSGSVTTIEVDAAVAYIARGIHILAGAQGEVQIRVGCAGDWVTTGQLGEIDLLLMDHRGTIYHEDLNAAEMSLAPDARVWADNVLYPGAPLFLHYIEVMGYSIEIHELKEYLRDDLDDWVVICKPGEKKGLPLPRETPPELRRTSAEVDRISWKSQTGPVDWVAFNKHVKPVFYAWKEKMGL